MTSGNQSAKSSVATPTPEEISALRSFIQSFPSAIEVSMARTRLKEIK
ncbi:MAG: hypothetical protein GY854_02950 [Deltaproteobacteria bacterium]|nr:hypothetical protein [Deltaproteobacteria bacterium]